MKKSLFAPLILGTCLLACIGEEDPVADIPLDGELKINILPNYPSTYNEFWVILHTPDGKPLETRKVEGESSLVFQVDDAQRFHLTTYRKAESFGRQVEFLESFTDIAVNEDITLGLTRPFPETPAISGQFTVNVSHTSLPFGAAVISPNQNYNFQGSQIGPSVSLTAKHETASKDYFLLAKSESGEMRYEILDVPNPGVSFTRKFSDLKQFDKVFKFNKSDFSQFYYTCVALKKVDKILESSYIVNSNQLPLLGFGPSASHQIGFLDQIENYELRINGKRNPASKTSFGYYRIGTAPSSITIPEEREIQVQSRLLSDFRFTMPSENTDWVAVWDQSEPFTGENLRTLRWIIRGSKPEVKLSLPSNLTQEKPKLQDLSKFSLESIALVKQSLSYDKQIRNLLVEWPKLEPIEYTSVTQYF